MEASSPLNDAFRQIELTEANLVKLEKLWSKIESQYPSELVFGGSDEVDDLLRLYASILEQMPKINGEMLLSVPMDLDSIAQNRLDALEIGEFEAKVMIEQHIYAPEKELKEYRFNLEKTRRQLVRNSVDQTVTKIDSLLLTLGKTADLKNEADDAVLVPEWECLKEEFAALMMMLGKDLPSNSRGKDLQRHLKFGLVCDLRDIIDVDWPSVKQVFSELMYGENDPLPVAVDDLSELLKGDLSGPIVTKLKWGKLNPEDFERLIFALVSNQTGYENPEWLMKTNAPDRGRDLSVYRVTTDELSGTIRSRVIIQCKHWQSKSVSVSDIASLEAQMKLWEPPRVDVHVIATSSRFTSDAVAYIEKHNQSNSALRIEMWAESHLELILSARPALIANYHLR